MERQRRTFILPPKYLDINFSLILAFDPILLEFYFMKSGFETEFNFPSHLILKKIDYLYSKSDLLKIKQIFEVCETDAALKYLVEKYNSYTWMRLTIENKTFFFTTNWLETDWNSDQWMKNGKNHVRFFFSPSQKLGLVIKNFFNKITPEETILMSTCSFYI
jgi:hypothetical protein